MEQLIYTPDEKPNENVIKAHDELLNASFGWGSNMGILGLLFAALFNPNINNEEWNKEMENATTDEEKQQVLKSHLDDYWTKAFDKICDPSPEKAQDLLDRLSDVNSKLDELNEQKRDIIDDWIME